MNKAKKVRDDEYVKEIAWRFYEKAFYECVGAKPGSAIRRRFEQLWNEEFRSRGGVV